VISKYKLSYSYLYLSDQNYQPTNIFSKVFHIRARPLNLPRVLQLRQIPRQPPHWSSRPTPPAPRFRRRETRPSRRIQQLASHHSTNSAHLFWKPVIPNPAADRHWTPQALQPPRQPQPHPQQAHTPRAPAQPPEPRGPSYQTSDTPRWDWGHSRQSPVQTRRPCGNLFVSQGQPCGPGFVTGRLFRHVDRPDIRDSEWWQVSSFQFQRGVDLLLWFDKAVGTRHVWATGHADFGSGWAKESVWNWTGVLLGLFLEASYCSSWISSRRWIFTEFSLV